MRLSPMLLAALALAAPAATQIEDLRKTPVQRLLSEAEDLAFVGVTVYTGSEKLEGVSVLVEGGKIKAIGKDLDVPPSFRRIEGGYLMPGLIAIGSTASLLQRSQPTPRTTMPRGRRGRRQMPTRRPTARPTFTPNVKVVEKVKPDHEDWASWLRAGVTTHAVRPPQSGLAGIGGVVRPVGEEPKDMVLAEESFVWLGMATNSATKKMLKENFAKAKEMVEKRKEAAKKKAAPAETKKPEAPKKPEEAKKPDAAEKPAEGKKPEPEKKEPPKQGPPKKDGEQKQPAADQNKKPEQKPEEKKEQAPKEDPRIAVLANSLEGKLPVMLGASSAGDLLHACAALDGVEMPLIVYSPFRRGQQDTIVHAVEQLKGRKAKVVVPAELAYQPDTSYFTNVIRTLAGAGISVALLPGTSERDLESLWFRLGELVRSGMKPEELVRMLTLEPAKLMKLEKQIGAIEAGKDANLLHFSRDPFSPASRLLHVYLEGRTVESVPTRH